MDHPKRLGTRVGARPHDQSQVHHKTSDTIDKVDAHNLAAGAAIVAITAYALAERAEPIAPHIDHGAVGENTKEGKARRLLESDRCVELSRRRGVLVGSPLFEGMLNCS